MNALLDNLLYMELERSLTHPADRIGKISKELRKIAQNHEAGKEINPKQIKKLAGSLDYWSDKSWKAGFFWFSSPLRL